MHTIFTVYAESKWLHRLLLMTFLTQTFIQLAAFWERGMVSDRFSDLFKDGRSSYGIGARVVLSGVIIRFDLARRNEGTQSQLFITYPWSMFSVDNPG